MSKAHTQKTALPAAERDSALELDSCTSSDALLMNLFCYPNVVQGAIANLVGVSEGAAPEFGVPGEAPLTGGRVDATEVDMRIGTVNFEAKLTEASFTDREKAHVERYAQFATVFEPSLLPQNAERYMGYQLIRNVLAFVCKPKARFVVLLDARRPDLMHEWWNIHGAIRQADVRARCGFLTWQELATAAPRDLGQFLGRKYGLLTP